jgi:hypothetical protein
VLSVLLIAMLGACSGDGGHTRPQLTFADLSATDDTCPLDLAAAVREAGLLPASPNDMEVAVDPGPGQPALQPPVGHISAGRRVYVVKDQPPRCDTEPSENVMNVMMIRAKLKAESVSDIDAAAEKMFSAIDAAQPAGVKYASMRLADGVSAVAVLALEDPADNQLQAIPEFREFQEQLPEWLAEPPIVEPLTVIGSYELF